MCSRSAPTARSSMVRRREGRAHVPRGDRGVQPVARASIRAGGLHSCEMSGVFGVGWLGRGPAASPTIARPRPGLTRAAAPPRPAAMQLPVLDRLILGAQKPSRYAGGELNAVHKRLDRVALKWGLAFPDTYEVGMSNVGFRLL